MSRSTRFLIGLAALLTGGAGFALLVWGDGGVLDEVLIRVGIILAAVWLVGPVVRRPALTTASMAVGAVALVVLPRLGIVLLAATIFLARRRRGPSN